jgi:hypothetical protein
VAEEGYHGYGSKQKGSKSRELHFDSGKGDLCGSCDPSRRGDESFYRTHLLYCWNMQGNLLFELLVRNTNVNTTNSQVVNYLSCSQSLPSKSNLCVFFLFLFFL